MEQYSVMAAQMLDFSINMDLYVPFGCGCKIVVFVFVYTAIQWCNHGNHGDTWGSFIVGATLVVHIFPRARPDHTL